MKKCLTLQGGHATAEEDLENLAVIYCTQAQEPVAMALILEGDSQDF